MPTHEYTPDELIRLATDDLRQADRLEADQVADPTTVSRIMVAHASAQSCALIAIARLLHEQVHKHPVEDITTGGMFSPLSPHDGAEDQMPAPLTSGEILRLRAFLSDESAS